MSASDSNLRISSAWSPTKRELLSVSPASIVSRAVRNSSAAKPGPKARARRVPQANSAAVGRAATEKATWTSAEKRRLAKARDAWRADEAKHLANAETTWRTEEEIRLSESREAWEEEERRRLGEVEVTWKKAEDTRLSAAKKAWERDAKKRLAAACPRGMARSRTA